MNVLHFTQSLEPLQGAGLGYSALGMHRGFLENGTKSVLLATCADAPMEVEAGVREFKRSGPERGFFAFDMMASARESVAQADVVHGHGFYVGSNLFLGREARRQKKPMVYHVQGFMDPWILARSKMKKRLAGWIFENSNFKYTSLWRAVSEKEAKQIRDYGIKAPIVVLPNGVRLPDLDFAHEVSKESDPVRRNGKRRAIFLSRVHPKKGLDLLVRAWAAMPANLRGQWVLEIFGPDEGGYATKVEEMIQSAGLSSEIKLMGGVSGAAKDSAFRSADLFILPSYSEGFPMAVLEAAAHSIPVIQTTECNFPELAVEGGAWECLPELDGLNKVLAEALACGNDELCQRGRLGRNLVARNYEWKAIANTMEEACREYC